MTHPEANGSAAPAAGEALVRLRSGPHQLLVPLAAVERVLPAALPSVQPAAGERPHPRLQVGEESLPVLFAEVLLGEPEARLRAEHQLLLVGVGPRRALLWADAVEDVVSCTPRPGPAGPLVAGWSADGEGLASLPVVDVPAILALAASLPEAA